MSVTTDPFGENPLGGGSPLEVNDIVVKSNSCNKHIKDLEKVYEALRRMNMRLNPKKCVFGVEGGVFGFYVNPPRD